MDRAHPRVGFVLCRADFRVGLLLSLLRIGLGLCDDLLTDMEFEERELLNEKILRDDFILLDASDS